MYSGNICDIKGLYVGHAQNDEAKTGCTVLLDNGEGFICGVDVRGASPGTRELDLLNPENAAQWINAIVLTGGSAFGLDAATGVQRALEQKGIGFPTKEAVVPLVCAAVIYDLGIGSAKIRPDAKMGEEAVANATDKPVFGSVGGGCGAIIGKFVPNSKWRKSGVGSASMKLPGGGTVAAMMLVNAGGDIYDHHTGKMIASATIDGKPVCAMDSMVIDNVFGQNTTIGIVATDVKLSKLECKRLATVCHDGYALAIRPTHTNVDGDTLFAVSKGDCVCDPVILQMTATEVVARAIQNAVMGVEA